MFFDPNHLAALSALLRTGGFDAAARELNLTQSAISQRIKALETRVGAQLVNRGKHCTGTPIGLRLANHADQISLLEAQLGEDLDSLGPRPRTRIHLAVNADSLDTWFLDALAGLPDHLFKISIDDQDYSADWLRRGEVICAVTAQADAAPGCEVAPLGALPYVATASPDFVARHFPDGVDADSLASAPMLRFNAKDRLQHDWMTLHFGATISPPLHDLPSTEGFVRASRLGIGWGVNPLMLVEEELSAGTLVTLADGARIDTPLFWQVTRLMAPALAPLTRSVRKTARRLLVQT